jgi:hypothetical protein
MRIAIAATLLWLAAGSAALARGGLDDFLTRVNVEARTDLHAFAAKISAQFEIPEAKVRVVLSAVSDPADAFMVFQIGQFCHCSTDTVLPVYRSDKGKGWGVIAKQLGIKPGSPEFHALKNGDLQFTGVPSQAANAKGKGKAKGHGNGKANGKS